MFLDLLAAAVEFGVLSASGAAAAVARSLEGGADGVLGALFEADRYLAQFKKDRLSDIEIIRSKDPALASLRKRKDFVALFETPAR